MKNKHNKAIEKIISNPGLIGEDSVMSKDLEWFLQTRENFYVQSLTGSLDSHKEASRSYFDAICRLRTDELLKVDFKNQKRNKYGLRDYNELK